MSKNSNPRKHWIHNKHHGAAPEYEHTCMGVPVRHHRRSAIRAEAAIETWLLEDFMVCASSNTTLNHLTE